MVDGRAECATKLGPLLQREKVNGGGCCFRNRGTDFYANIGDTSKKRNAFCNRFLEDLKNSRRFGRT